MKSTRDRLIYALAAAVLVGVACSISPLQAAGSGHNGQAAPLERCDDLEDVLCLLTFAVEPPSDMRVTLRGAPEPPAQIEVVITHRGEEILYTCESAGAAPTLLYCIGPQLPLGSTVLIEVFDRRADILLSRGEFTLVALALPTVPTDGLIFPTP